MRRALLVDLDDTLYDERAYVDSGFRHVAEMVSRECGVPATALVASLDAGLRLRGRGRLFDDLLEAHGLAVTPDRVGALVDAYRRHRPAIVLDEGVRRTLDALRADFALAIVTDGLELMQRRKVEALGLEAMVDAVVYCWEHGQPKPSAGAFRIALDRLGNPPLAAVVGDDVSRDLPAAVTLGAPFIRVRSGRFVAVETPPVPVPIAEVASFSDVPDAIARVAAGDL